MSRARDYATRTLAISGLPEKKGKGRLALQQYVNKIFFSVVRFLIVINQLLCLAPISWRRNRKVARKPLQSKAFKNLQRSRQTQRLKALCGENFFFTKRWLTISASLVALLWCCLGPYVVYNSLLIYRVKNRYYDNIFVVIAVSTMASEVIVSLIILLTQIWHRENLAKFLNLFAANIQRLQCFNVSFVSFKVLALVLLKVAHVIYGIIINLPFIFKNAKLISWSRLWNYLVTLYISQFGAICSLNAFVAILLIKNCFQQMRQSMQRAAYDTDKKQLLRMENSMQQLVKCFLHSFQLPIFFWLLFEFINLLANLYAFLNYYAASGNIYYGMLTYSLILLLDLYTLILAAYWCQREKERLNEVIIEQESDKFLNNSWSESTNSRTETTSNDLLWPRPFALDILSMFTLSHEFCLFLISYAASFVVLILQFAFEKHNM